MREIELNPLDEHMARKMADLAGVTPGTSFFQAVRLVCFAAANGHVCLDLRDYTGQEISFNYLGSMETIPLPEIDVWIDELASNPLVGDGTNNTPFVLDNKHSRLYLHRYWQYERHLITAFKHLSAAQLDASTTQADMAKHLFADTNSSEEQQQASQMAGQSQLCIITGGPGTGKTTTIVSIMAMLLTENPWIKIILTAPTGKAAARLSESVANGKKLLLDKISPEIAEKISIETQTIHRLLKSRRNSIFFQHNAENPLPIDCLILDEASMVDIALMSKLIQALPDKCRLILLGDANQLSSVEAGAVFGDLCSTADPQLLSKITYLKKSHRFKSDQGIGRLSHLVLSGSGREAYDYLSENQNDQIAWEKLPEPNQLQNFIEKTIIPHAEKLANSGTIEIAFQQLRSFLVLTALRVGIFGSVNLNDLVSDLLIQFGHISPATEWYPGRPIIITRNDYGMGLFNGDLGICFPDPEENRLAVYFETSDGYRKIVPSRLPSHESVYALTIHKSQGSEFDGVALILPDRESEVLTRELIYTGITRARSSLTIVGNKEVFIKSVSKSVKRSSGLKEGLDET